MGSLLSRTAAAGGAGGGGVAAAGDGLPPAHHYGCEGQEGLEEELGKDGAGPIDLACEVSVHGFVQEMYSLSQGGRCRRCRPPQQQQQAEDHKRELMTLVDICVDEICKNILLYEAPLPFDCLPPELVRRLWDSLTNHKALTKLTLQSLRDCDVTRLDLSSCKDVSDNWLEPFATKTLTHLSLASCPGVTDAGLLHLTELGALQHANLTGCTGLRSEGLAAFGESWLLTTLNLSGCRHLTDKALKPLAHLPALQHLRLRGCRQLTDVALSHLSPLTPRMKTLDLNEGAQFSASALCGCLGGLHEIEYLDLGYCSKGMGRETLEVLTRGRASATLHTLILDASRGLTNADLYSLGQLGSLKKLSLRGCTAISDAGLCQLPLKLEEVDVSHCRGVRRLPAQSLLKLKKINFAHSGLRDSDVGSLSEFGALVDINLDSCAIGNTGLTALLPLKNLQRLNLADTGVSNQGMDVLASLASLSSLSLFYTNITDAGVHHLCTLTNLTSLNLDNRELTDQSLLHISTLTKLRHLDVFSARVSDVGLCFISSLSELVSLEICGGKITDLGLEYIARLPALRRLNVSQNARVTNKGLLYLVKLDDLEVLNVSHCQVCAPGALGPLGKMRGLRVLAVNGCKGMNDKGALMKLQASLPFLRTVKAVC